MSIVAAYAVPHPPLIIPAIGNGQEKSIQKTIQAYEEVARRVLAHTPQTVIVLSPHAPLQGDSFDISTGGSVKGSMAQFSASNVEVTVQIDDEFSTSLSSCLRDADIKSSLNALTAANFDHATFIPLHFILQKYSSFRVVRIGVSGLSADQHRMVGRCIAKVASSLNRSCVVIASGDLSHKLKADGPYGFAPEGPVFDRNVTALLNSGDLSGLFTLPSKFCESAAECGLRALQIMCGTLDDTATTHELLNYEAPFGVGYAVAAFEVRGVGGDGAVASSINTNSTSRRNLCNAVDEKGDDPFVALARHTVEEYVRTKGLVSRPTDVPSALTEAEARTGVFVSLYKNNELRGCIGTIEATTGCVADEIIRNAIAAASQDPRFTPVTPEELDFLSYSVDVLFPAEDVESYKQLNPARYGVIVTKDNARGLLLPNLEGVNTVEEQLSIALRKAGLSPDEEDIHIERFEVIRHSRCGEALKMN